MCAVCQSQWPQWRLAPPPFATRAPPCMLSMLQLVKGNVTAHRVRHLIAPRAHCAQRNPSAGQGPSPARQSPRARPETESSCGVRRPRPAFSTRFKSRARTACALPGRGAAPRRRPITSPREEVAADKLQCSSSTARALGQTEKVVAARGGSSGVGGTIGACQELLDAQRVSPTARPRPSKRLHYDRARKRIYGGLG